MTHRTVSHAHRTCTARSAVNGECGAPAIYSFETDRGEIFSECAAHYGGPVEGIASPMIGYRVGDKVEIHRYGKTYIGTVVYVGPRGGVEAEFTYGNGARRRVAI